MTPEKNCQKKTIKIYLNCKTIVKRCKDRTISFITAIRLKRTELSFLPFFPDAWLTRSFKMYTSTKVKHPQLLKPCSMIVTIFL